jgi:Ca2+-binding EF-hand superfamily protein
VEALHETFKAFDKNGNGMIEANELQTLLRQLGHPATQEEAQQFLNMIDYDGNGVITFDEFVIVMAQRLRDAHHERKMIEAFRFFDKDNSGYITAEELKAVLDSIGEKLSRQEIEEIIR